MTSRRITVSVVIPTYNRARYLQEAIGSALAQTDPAEEIIVVDDGSTDETASVLAAYGGNIRVINQVNAGVAAARNAGIAASKGDYIALLDSDDAWLPEKLAFQRQLAARWPEAVLIHTLCFTMDGDGRDRQDSREEYAPRLEEDALERLMGHCYPTTSTYFLQAKALRDVGGFDSAFEQGGGFAAEDWDLCLRLAERGPFASIGKPLARYRVHGDSKTLQDKLPHTLGLINLRKRIEARKAHWLAARDSPALRRALAQHTHGFAHVYGRLGLIYQQRGEYSLARQAFAEAMRLEPGRLKHRLRYWRMRIASARELSPQGENPV
jgi:glycosyltransferase involved in cell wall biosynthesis